MVWAFRNPVTVCQRMMNGVDLQSPPTKRIGYIRFDKKTFSEAALIPIGYRVTNKKITLLFFVGSFFLRTRNGFNLKKKTRVEIPGNSRYVIHINSLVSFLPAKTTWRKMKTAPWKMKHIYNKNQFSGSMFNQG